MGSSAGWLDAAARDNPLEVQSTPAEIDTVLRGIRALVS